MSKQDDIDRPVLFYSSINWRIAFGLISFVVFLVLGILALSSRALDPVSDAILFAIALLELFLGTREFFSSIRTAVFYNERFEAIGRQARKQFDYSEIERVDLIKGMWGACVLISLNGQNRSVVIPTNPKNLSLKTNLYEFLKQRIAT